MTMWPANSVTPARLGALAGLASGRGGSPLGQGVPAKAMAADTLTLGKANDTVARTYLDLGRNLAKEKAWERIASPLRKAFDSAATQAVLLEAFAATFDVQRTVATARPGYDAISSSDRKILLQLDNLERDLESMRTAGLEKPLLGAKRNDTVSRSYASLAKAATTQKSWTRVAAPMSKAVPCAATMEVAVEAFLATAEILRAVRKERASHDSDYAWDRPIIAELTALAASTTDTQLLALKEACTLATTSAQALTMVESLAGASQPQMTLVFERAIGLGQTVEELVVVAKVASQKQYWELAEKATDKANTLSM